MHTLTAMLRKMIPRILALALVFNGMLYVLTTVLATVDDTFFAEAVHDVNYYLDVTTARNLSGILGLLFGLYLMLLGKGLYRRYRRSWTAAIITLTILVADSFFLSSVPQVKYLTLAMLIVLLLSFSLFRERSQYALLSSRKIMAWLSVALAIAYGACGSYLLRSEFNNLKTWTDAVYYTFVTYSTVGFGDIYPITQNAKYFTVSMILVGLGSFATALSFVVGPMVEQRMKGVLNLMKKFYTLNHHVIICGYTSLSKVLIQELKASEQPFVIIENRPDCVLEIQNLEYPLVPGSGEQRQPFEQANLAKANAVFCAYDDDASNILTVLTVQEMAGAKGREKLRLIARVDHEENIEKMHALKVDHVVSPATMGARAMLEMYRES
jgi:voltage-gated potassium channel